MGINICIAVLSYLGGVGFIVLTDFWEFLRGKRAQITFTTKVILSFSVLVSVLGTVSIYFLEPSIQTLNAEQKWMVAFFQAMSASTTVGFNTISISSLSLPVVMILYFLMFFGASPAGTGGGLKSTTLSALLAEIWSQLRSYKNIQFFGREIPDWRVRAASTSASLYGIILGLGIFALTLAMPQASFDKIVFEAISALGTVGLSMGLSSELNAWGKLILIALMYIGRLGVISFGLLLVAPAADNQDSHNKAIEDLAI